MKNLIAFCFKCQRYIGAPFQFPSKTLWDKAGQATLQDKELQKVREKSQNEIKNHDLSEHPRSEDFPNFALVELPTPPKARRKVR